MDFAYILLAYDPAREILKHVFGGIVLKVNDIHKAETGQNRELQSTNNFTAQLAAAALLHFEPAKARENMSLVFSKKHMLDLKRHICLRKQS